MSRLRKKNIVLLTATVSPRTGQAGLAIADPMDRLSQYRASLDYYGGLADRGVIDGVVFFDNSGAGTDLIGRNLRLRNVEIFSEDGLDYPEHYHRGYGEFKLIDRAYELSEQLAGADSRLRVWKITGRYRVLNLRRVIDTAPFEADIYCDVQRQWAEMSVMAWSINGYARLVKGVHEQFASGMAPELALAKLLCDPDIARMLSIETRFNWPPFIDGTRGSDGTRFGGRAPKLRHAVEVLRRVSKGALRNTGRPL